jgi:LysM repeat protein
MNTYELFKKNNSVATFNIPGKNYFENPPIDSLESGNSDIQLVEPIPISDREPTPKKKEPVRVNKTYVVKSGDTLSKIADKFNVSLTKLKSKNGLNSDVIRPGQKLKIP